MLLAWSGGKDAALALEELSRAGTPATGLVTTFGAETKRTSMHGVRRSLMEAQAVALDLPLHIIEVPGDGTREGYRRVMQEALTELDADRIAYADLFLEDIREYREALLDEIDYTGVWPLWNSNTKRLVETLLDDAYQCITVVVDGSALSPAFLGQSVSRSFVAALPDAVDPCGERGEFHTFVADAPSFTQPVPVRPGRRLTRDLGGTPFHYADILFGRRVK